MKLLSKSLIMALQRLVQGERVAASMLRADVASELLGEGLLTVQAHGSRRTYRAINAQALRQFLVARYDELRALEENGPFATHEPHNTGTYASDEPPTRARQAAATGNSKLVRVRSCPGFPVNSYEPLACWLGGRPFVVQPPAGSFVYVDDWCSFTIPADVVVVGIENMENFRMIRQQRLLFEACIGPDRLLFVSRYPQSTDLRSWLQGITNRYVHFGDFDLAGIHIFLTEFRRFLGQRASFLIPPDIGRRLAEGSTERYNDQYARFARLTIDIAPLQHLIGQINDCRRCYDQEGYIGAGYVSDT